MARYRKIDPRIWNDKKFRSMTDAGKLVFLFVLTHPHMTSIGAMRATLGGLADELGWELKAFREAFGEAFEKGMVKHDPKASFLALPNFLKYNAPESPNVVKAWVSASDLLPECDLKEEVIQWVKDFVEGLPEAFAKALPKDFAKGMPNQEQEQEQYLNQEQEQTYLVRKVKKTSRIGPSDPNLSPKFFEFWELYPRKEQRAKAAIAYAKLAPSQELHQTILDALGKQRETAKWKFEPQFIPHPTTWLNGKRWEDDIESISPTPSPMPAPLSKTRQGVETLMRGVNGHEPDRAGNPTRLEQTGLLELGPHPGDGHARRNR